MLFINLIFAVKIIFILLASYGLYLKKTGKINSTQYKNIEFYKERIDFVFVFLMSILLIIIFNPRMPRFDLLNKEAKLLIFLFGIVLIITAKWKVFIEQSQLFTDLQQLLGH